MSMTGEAPGQAEVPLVSIMIPTYGQAALVCRAIDSACAQTYPRLEIVVADDCSPDDTQQVVISHLASLGDPRVRYHRHAGNLGILRNYHTTLNDLVSGQWVINLDGDDYFLDNGFIARAVSLAQAHPAMTLVLGNYAEVAEPAGRRLDIINRELPECMTDQDFLMRFARGEVLWNHNAILYRRDVALDKGCYWSADAPRNDWESFLRMVMQAQVGHVPTVAAAWVQHARNETKRLDVRKYLNNFTLIDGVARHGLAAGLPAGFNASWRQLMLSKSARSSAGAYAKQADWRGMLGFLWQVRHIDVGVALRTALAPDIWGRMLLARMPGLYDWVKARLRGQAHA